MEDERQTPRPSKVPYPLHTQQPKPQLKGPARLTRDQIFKSIDVSTNLFEVIGAQKRKLVVYYAKITPSIPDQNQSLLKKLFYTIMPELFKIVPHTANPIFSEFTIYSTEKLKEEGQFSEDDYQIVMQHLQTLELPDSTFQLLPLLKHSLRNFMVKNNFQEIDKSGNYFNLQKKEEIDNFVIYDLYKTEFVELERKLFLKVDLSKKVISNKTVLDFINDFYKNHHGNDEEKLKLLQAQLTNKIVMIKYGQKNHFKVVDVCFKKAKHVIIDQKTNMLQHYSNQYNINIQDKQSAQFLLIVKGKNLKQTLLFPELCVLTGIPKNFNKMRRKEIQDPYLIEGPDTKVKRIQNFIKQLQKSGEMQFLDDLGITILTEMLNLKAKLIPPPQLTCCLPEKETSHLLLIFSFKQSSKQAYSFQYITKTIFFQNGKLQ